VRAAVFFDRDGVLTKLIPDPESGLPESPLHPRQVELEPNAAVALSRLRERGYALVGVSNQPAAAKGTVPLERLHAVQARVLELLERDGVVPDAFMVCFHHPEGSIPELTRTCDCRKPAPGMLLAAARELGLDLGASWMIGDTDGDIAAGVAAGCRTIMIQSSGGAHKRSGTMGADACAQDLAAAAALILAGESGYRSRPC
jgi:D-glycero-D-manno-heptose 1,7-bisphosphate phosphatase